MTKEQNKPLRVLQVFGSLARGGAETWLMDVMRNIRREEFAIDICLTGHVRGAYEEEFENLGGKIHRCPLGRNPWRFSRRFEQILNDGRYDVVHSHLYYFSGLILRLTARAGIPKRVAHIHPAEDFKARRVFRGLYAWWMKRLIIRYGTNFVGPTKASLENFWGPGWQKDESRKVIYNCVNIKRFIETIDKTQVRRQLDIPEDAKIVLNVSRYSPHKRHEFLVQTAEHLLAKQKNVYFVLVGRGELKKTIEEKVNENGLAENFRFIEGAPSIDEYFLASDVFAFPSCNEGFGIVIVEAALAGLRIIAQDIPGVREAAQVCPDCKLLPLDTPTERWALVLLEAIEKPKMPEQQRQEFIARFPFTIENSVAKLREIYNG